MRAGETATRLNENQTFKLAARRKAEAECGSRRHDRLKTIRTIKMAHPAPHFAGRYPEAIRSALITDFAEDGTLRAQRGRIRTHRATKRQCSHIGLEASGALLSECVLVTIPKCWVPSPVRN